MRSIKKKLNNDGPIVGPFNQDVVKNLWDLLSEDNRQEVMATLPQFFDRTKKIEETERESGRLFMLMKRLREKQNEK